MPLEMVTVDVNRRVPLKHQPDNVVINDVKWIKEKNIYSQDLGNFVESPANLWGAGDRVSASKILSGDIEIAQSLYFIKPEKVEVYKKNEKRRASITYNGENYDLAVTDPNFDKIQSGEKKMQGYVCVSLGEEFNGDHYKIAAAII